MPFYVENETISRYTKLYRWHTREIAKLEQKLLETTDDEERNGMEQVQRNFIAERARIRRRYPNSFSEDIFDSKF